MQQSITYSYNLTEFLGQSILSPAFKSFRSHFKLTNEPSVSLDYKQNVYNAELKGGRDGIFIEFSGYRRYKQEFGEPQYIEDNSNDELIIKEIAIDNLYAKKKEQAKVQLPFGIQFGDGKDTLIKKLSKKPYEKTPNTYGYGWWFIFNDYRLLAALNPGYEVIWIRLLKLTNDEQEKIQLKKYLSQQNKNIHPANAALVMDYAKNLPTLQWRLRKEEGDEAFTDKAILEVETLLKNYLQALATLTHEKKAVGIYNSARKIVKALNKVSSNNKGVIETLEREDLCDFINEAVRKTGLTIDQRIDITEEWREW